MNNFNETKRWFRDAEAAIKSAKQNMLLKDFRVVAQNSQLCVEQSAKSVISYFAEPQWTHNPARQLRAILSQYLKQLVDCYGNKLIELEKLAEYAEDIAVWHAWSTYGRQDNEGNWIPAVDLCTEDVAKQCLCMARYSFEVVQKFMDILNNLVCQKS